MDIPIFQRRKVTPRKTTGPAQAHTGLPMGLGLDPGAGLEGCSVPCTLGSGLDPGLGLEGYTVPCGVFLRWV